ncbi:MAG: Holliday junction resolvase RuvX [Pirellulaceae bacterium]
MTRSNPANQPSDAPLREPIAETTHSSQLIQGFPSSGRLAGIDFGSVRVGLALCDPSQTWVTPLAIYERRSKPLDGDYLARLAGQEQLVGWVVGLPLHCSGEESQKSTEARHFARWLGERTALPVALFDERFTTAEARRLLNQTALSANKRRQRLDGMAAHLILSHFLGARGSGASSSAPLDDATG